MTIIKDSMINRTFGKWKVIQKVKRAGFRQTYYTCQCECGIMRPAKAHSLKNGLSKSCTSCSHSGPIKPLLMIGASYGKWTIIRYMGQCVDYYIQLYLVRCECGLEKSLDRYTLNDGNYEPGNCRWVSRLENANNRRISITNRGRYITINKNKLCESCRHLI